MAVKLQFVEILRPLSKALICHSRKLFFYDSRNGLNSSNIDIAAKLRYLGILKCAGQYSVTLADRVGYEN